MDVWDHHQLFDVGPPGHFHPDVLPNPNSPGIPTQEIFGLPLLLADRLCSAVIVSDANNDFVVLFDKWRDVNNKGGVAAAVMFHVVTVKPDVALVVNRLKMKEVGLVLVGADLKMPTVPDDWLVIFDGNASCWKSVAVRNIDCLIKRAISGRDLGTAYKIT